MLHATHLIALHILYISRLEKREKCNRKSENSFLHVMIHKYKITVMLAQCYLFSLGKNGFKMLLLFTNKGYYTCFQIIFTGV